MEECNKLGIKALKFEVKGTKGVPDRIILLPKGKTLFIEFKKPNGLTSVHQDEFIEYLHELGFDAYVFDNWEKPLELVKSFVYN